MKIEGPKSMEIHSTNIGLEGFSKYFEKVFQNLYSWNGFSMDIGPSISSLSPTPSQKTESWIPRSVESLFSDENELLFLTSHENTLHFTVNHNGF